MRLYILEILMMFVTTSCLIGCIHAESGLGNYNYQTKTGSVQGNSQIQKIGIQNIVARGAFGVGAGLISTRYSDMTNSRNRNSIVDTSGSYFGMSLGTNFGRQKNHSLFAEVNRINESFQYSLFQDYDQSDRSYSENLQFRTIASNQYSIGYRYSIFWKDRPSKRGKASGSRSGPSFSGVHGDGAIIILGIALIYLATEAIAESIEKTTNYSNINSFSFHVKYNYRHATFPENALLRGMDTGHNELFERSVTAGFVIDWL